MSLNRYFIAETSDCSRPGYQEAASLPAEWRRRFRRAYGKGHRQLALKIIREHFPSGTDKDVDLVHRELRDGTIIRKFFGVFLIFLVLVFTLILWLRY